MNCFFKNCIFSTRFNTNVQCNTFVVPSPPLVLDFHARQCFPGHPEEREDISWNQSIVSVDSTHSVATQQHYSSGSSHKQSRVSCWFQGQWESHFENHWHFPPSRWNPSGGGQRASIIFSGSKPFGKENPMWWSKIYSSAVLLWSEPGSMRSISHKTPHCVSMSAMNLKVILFARDAVQCVCLDGGRKVNRWLSKPQARTYSVPLRGKKLPRRTHCHSRFSCAAVQKAVYWENTE